ncbi:hypothetical protein TNCV_4834821 [Trichonephila clavipes]|nr:hypothetical protein TNCV_4834821 [Trichonephila clavipes]
MAPLKKTNVVRSGDCGGHRTRPTCLIQLPEYTISSQYRTEMCPNLVMNLHASPFTHHRLPYFSRDTEPE